MYILILKSVRVGILKWLKAWWDSDNKINENGDSEGNQWKFWQWNGGDLVSENCGKGGDSDSETSGMVEILTVTSL